MFPIDCDFCDDKFESEKDMKVHLKNHMSLNVKIVISSVKIRVAWMYIVEKNLTVDFECGLCDHKANAYRYF